MSNLAILAFLVGAVFGMRFKILVLLPLSVFGGLNTFLVALILGEGTSVALLNGLVVILALQGGYLFGSVTRLSVAAARTGRAGSAHAQTRVQKI